MVPRDQPETSPPEGPPNAIPPLLEAWRRVLARLVGPLPAIGKTLRALLTGTTNDSMLSPTACIAIASTFVGIGIGLWIFVEAASGSSLSSAAALAVVGSVWIPVRLGVMRTVARSAPVDSTSITLAWSAGALPWIAVAFPGMRLGAWAAGFLLAFRMLKKTGTEPRDAWLITGVGFGFEVLGLILIWLARNAVIAGLLLS